MSTSLQCYPSTDGIYQIFSVAFPQQDADLLSSSADSLYGTIGGYMNNSGTQRMLWNVELFISLPDSAQFTLLNEEFSTFASISESNNGVTGNPYDPLVWTAKPVDGQDGCIIFAPLHNNLAWTLANGENYTPITAEELSNGSPSATQLWNFVPVSAPVE